MHVDPKTVLRRIAPGWVGFAPMQSTLLQLVKVLEGDSFSISAGEYNQLTTPSMSHPELTIMFECEVASFRPIRRRGATSREQLSLSPVSTRVRSCGPSCQPKVGRYRS